MRWIVIMMIVACIVIILQFILLIITLEKVKELDVQQIYMIDKINSIYIEAIQNNAALTIMFQKEYGINLSEMLRELTDQVKEDMEDDNIHCSTEFYPNDIQ